MSQSVYLYRHTFKKENSQEEIKRNSETVFNMAFISCLSYVSYTLSKILSLGLIYISYFLLTTFLKRSRYKTIQIAKKMIRLDFNSLCFYCFSSGILQTSFILLNIAFISCLSSLSSICLEGWLEVHLIYLS